MAAEDRPDTGERRDHFPAAGGVRRLGSVIAELAAVDDLAALTEVIVAHCLDAVGAKGAGLSVLDQTTGTLILLGVTGGHSEARQRWAKYSLQARTPASEALREHRTVVARGRENIERLYPDLQGQVGFDGCLICLPLTSGGRDLGVVSLSVLGTWIPDSAELEYLSILANICAQALERIQARAEAAESAAQLEFMAAASAELASSLDYQATLSTVARLAVPTVADWCAVAILDDGRLRTLAVAHIDPAKIALAAELQERYPPDPAADQGPSHVVRSGMSELFPEITDDMLMAGCRDDEHLRLARELKLRSALVVPLIARERTLGVITFVYAESGRTYAQPDLRFAEDLARRAAIAIDNAHLHSETRDAALRLQQAVLPQALALPDWEVATYYRPAGRTEVGGDFYDAVQLPDGRLVVVIGDVMGRGVAAAAAMAQMRAAIHAYIAIDPDPATVMSKLDRMFTLFHQSRLVAMVYVLVSASGDELSIVNAGHCPPILVRPDGSATLLMDAPTTPVGLVVRPRPAHTHEFPPGGVLLCYTDGLVERREEDLDIGLARIAEHARALTDGRLGSTLATMIGRVTDPGRDDDAAALAIRRSARA